MKTNFKKAIMPLAVVMLGAVAAFATNATKQNNPEIVDAYYYDSSKPSNERCINVEVDNCTTMITSHTCTDSSNRQLWNVPAENGLQCSFQLYKL